MDDPACAASGMGSGLTGAAEGLQADTRVAVAPQSVAATSFRISRSYAVQHEWRTVVIETVKNLSRTLVGGRNGRIHFHVINARAVDFDLPFSYGLGDLPIVRRTEVGVVSVEVSSFHDGVERAPDTDKPRRISVQATCSRSQGS